MQKLLLRDLRLFSQTLLEFYTNMAMKNKCEKYYVLQEVSTQVSK